MRAVLLAAGRGKRLGSTSPKVLTDVGGKTLLERHLTNMVEAGITALTIVVGFEQGQLREALVKIPTTLPIDLLENHRFEICRTCRGSPRKRRDEVTHRRCHIEIIPLHPGMFGGRVGELWLPTRMYL